MAMTVVPQGGALVATGTTTGAVVPIAMTPFSQGRRSHLQAPIMLLTGHGGEVYSLKFHREGKVIASSSFDKAIFLWNVYGDCENYYILKGHTSAVLEVHWTKNNNLVSCSADKTVQVFDAISGQRVKKFIGHTSFVNSCCPSRSQAEVSVSGSDDTTAKVWDARVKSAVQSLPHRFAVTSVAFGEEHHQVFTGCLDNEIRMWDLRALDSRGEVCLALKGHEDTVTGIAVSPDGSYVLSNSMDNTVRGVQHNFEKNLLRCSWSPDGQRIAAGSADRFVWIWDTTTRNALYKLPGHVGSVNDVQFHPLEPIIGSCSSDKNIYLGEVKI
ncbi:U5 small nuclear ribonucleoprotein 40 kDa protein [Pelomyxa schiedti]|nr:U5 small nuclear ribonucleoprotein 40 kDa protein [Pelomyxa schiedti]